MPISDIKIFTLSKIEVEGGKVLHAIKNDDEGYLSGIKSWAKTIDFIFVNNGASNKGDKK